MFNSLCILNLLKFEICAGQLYEQFHAVGLDLCFVGRLISVELAALGAFVNDDISLFGICDYLDRLHWRAAFAGAVTGIYINVERPEAEGAVIARGVAQGLDLLAAMCANKSVIIFCKSFLFHFSTFYLIFTVSPGATFTVMLPEVNHTVSAEGLYTMLPLAEK